MSLANGEPEMLTDDERAILRQADGRIEVVRLRGNFSFASARQLTQMLGGILQGPRVVIFDFAQAAQIDTSAAYAIDELITDAQAAGVSCYVSGLSGAAEKTLAGLGVLAKLATGKVCHDRKSALEQAMAELPPAAAA
jgi:MFS superfamily sulfate permease-like transporter